jgi:hypothetical protein
VVIKGNETPDKAAKEALNEEVENTYKVVKSNWSIWAKRKSWQVRPGRMETLRKPHGDGLNQTSVDSVVPRASHGDNKSWYRDYGWGTQTSNTHTD